LRRNARAPLITAWFENQFRREGLTGSVDCDHGGQPFHTAPAVPFIQAAIGTLAEIFGREPALTREGLSIPATAVLQRELGIPVALIGLGLPDCAAHSPNESYPLSHLDLGARLFTALLERFATVGRG
jgi:acetylornithine deacetylase/succinyl-diaminopimelate desuccinylase-like protein